MNNANTVASRLNSLTTEIQKLRGDADLSISEACDQINDLLDDLQNLNDQIVKYKVWDMTAWQIWKTSATRLCVI